MPRRLHRLALAPLLCHAGLAEAVVIFVPGDHATIQAAIDAANPGDVVEVGNGVFTGPDNTNLHFDGKDITVRSANGLFNTQIDCQGTGRGFHLSGGETAAATIQGLVIRGGDPAGDGGGILLDGASPTIISCYVFDNDAENGGGIAVTNGSSPALQSSTVTSNQSTSSGGGVYVDGSSVIEITSCSIRSNFANGGGGLRIDSASGTSIENTSVTNNTSFTDGGGVELHGGASFQNTTLLENNAGGDGGGVCGVDVTSLSVTDCHVQGNNAGGDGGGILFKSDTPREAAWRRGTTDISGTVIAGNHAALSGGGVSVAALASVLTVTRTTVADNRADVTGGGLFVGSGSAVDVTRTILWGNCAPSGPAGFVEGTGTTDFACANVATANVEGGGNVTFDANTFAADPLFCLPSCCDEAPIYDIDNFFHATYTVAPGSPVLPPGTPCGQSVGAEGAACPEPFDVSGITVMSNVPPRDLTCGLHINDIWGYVSPSGREYAILGLGNGTAFVDVTDPVNPAVVDIVDDARSLWSDAAVYQEYAYNVNENGITGDGVQIIDLSDIDSGVVSLVGNWTGSGFTDAHNIAINEESGFAYLCIPNVTGRGILILDLANPTAPVMAGSWDAGTGRGVHDAQIVNWTGGPFDGREIAFCAVEGDGLVILDVTNKASIVPIGSAVYPNLTYCHQLWLSEDRTRLYVNDELDELQDPDVTVTTTYVFDITDLTNPFLDTTFSSGSTAIDHNMMVRGDYLYEANYTSGLRVFDLAQDPIAEIAYFDSHPEDDLPEFDGAWGVYALLPSGRIIVSDMTRGLYVLGPPEVIDTPTAAAPRVLTFAQNHPNPFNPATTYRFQLPEAGPVRLDVFDSAGRLVRTLVDDVRDAGPHAVTWDGRDAQGVPLASGVYLSRLVANGERLEQKSILLK